MSSFDYNDDNFRYKFEPYEVELIDKVWDFLELFNKKFIFIRDYRNYIIKTISEKYKPEEVLKLESIANKLFWNMRLIVYPFWENPNITRTQYQSINPKKSIPKYLTLCNYVTFNDKKDLKRKVNLIKINIAGNYYRSFINKLFIPDRQKKVLYFKEMEGSSSIFSKNYFNLMTSHIMMERHLYEKIVRNPFIIKTIDIPISEFYYQYDYGFPNLSFCNYSIGSDKYKLKRIKKLLYNDDDKYWFRIIY